MSKMKKSALLMNLGRGGIIEEVELARALKENLIRGAALDVLKVEPIEQEHPLYDVDPSKWIVTPHIAWASVEARGNLIGEVAANIETFFKGGMRNRIV